jgi:hypothetical protein
VLGLACAGCFPSILEQFRDSFGEVVPVNPNDSTPPEITMTLPNLYNPYGIGQIVLGIGDPPLTIPVSDIEFNLNPIIVAEAHDPEGVRQICLFPGGGSTCCSPDSDICTTTQPLFATICVGPQNAGTATTATTILWIPHSVDIGLIMACNNEPGSEDVSSIHACATNFGGQEVCVGPVVFVDP